MCYYIIVKEKEREVINMPSMNMVTIVGKYKGNYNYLEHTNLIIVEVDDMPVYIEVGNEMFDAIKTRAIDTIVGVRGKLGMNCSIYQPQMVIKCDKLSFIA